MGYLYELHCHTSEVSSCGKICATEIVKLLKENNYSGVVITDHFTPGGIKGAPITDWKEYIDTFLAGYRDAKEHETQDFHVFPGAEIRFPENDNDYLLLGVTEQFLYDNPYLNRTSLRECSEIAHRNGVLIVQAHPMRNSMTIMKPDYLDGYEVYNGNKRHNSRNEIADAWATRNGKIKTSGSDLHEYEDLARGGVWFEHEILTPQDLVTELKNGNYILKKSE
ncbi:MAG: PHP domain-containing protein [Ruminococcaceae bacterium]|nr:PHP domain-containing protein [Oscillospiraceae bacterium]